MFHIMIVEDDKSTLKWMEKIVSMAGYEVYTACDGIEALDVMDTNHVDLIVLDVMMPRMNGYEFTEQLRSVNNLTPILMVTAKELPEDRCKGFIAGTDDYMVKPVNETEMLLRIKALLRRAGIANEKKIKVGNIILDYDNLSVTMDGEMQTLPNKEFQLLYMLLSYPGKIFTRIQLMDEIWGMESNSSDTTINVHINRLRKRFEGRDEFEIVAIRGIGYKAVKNVK